MWVISLATGVVVLLSANKYASLMHIGNTIGRWYPVVLERS